MGGRIKPKSAAGLLRNMHSINDDWVEPELQNSSQAVSNSGLKLANELGIELHELDELLWEVHENASSDGLIYGYVIQFSEQSSPEILSKIASLDNNLSIRVDANFFDDPPGSVDDAWW